VQWPSYESPEIYDIGRVKVYAKTTQDLVVGLCNALHAFYQRATVRLTFECSAFVGINPVTENARTAWDFNHLKGYRVDIHTF